jgi:hypothetical protein
MAILLLFYTFNLFGNPGYLLGLIPALYLLLIYPVKRISRSKVGAFLIAILIAIEISIFFFLPPIFKQASLNLITFRQMREHDQRIGNYLQTVKQHAPDKTLLIALRGQYYNPQKIVKSYKYDDIRIFSYYLPEYEIFDIMGMKNFYSSANNYQTQDIHEGNIYFSHDANQLIILADYINSAIYPKNITFRAEYADDSVYNKYFADLTGIDNFSFNGYNFIRK